MTDTGSTLHQRLWRARRRYHYIDAFVREEPPGWVLEFQHNGRRLLTWQFRTEAEAEAEATRRLQDLQRSGWNTHW